MKKPIQIFKVGDRIGSIIDNDSEDEIFLSSNLSNIGLGDYEDNVVFGTVAELHPKNTITVKWDEAWLSQYDWSSKPISQQYFIEASVLKKKVSQLEAEFKITCKEVNSKIKEAAKLIKEANKIAKKKGNALQDMYSAALPLMNALDEAGWNSSSLWC